MPDLASLDDVLKEVRQFGQLGRDQAEKMAGAIEKVAQLQAEIAQLKGELGRAARDTYWEATADGKPPVMRAGESVEEFTERLKEHASMRQAVRYVEIDGRKVPVIDGFDERAFSRGRSTMRGVASITDKRGLTAVRMMRASMASVARGWGDTAEGALKQAKEWGDAFLAEAIEEARDLREKATSGDVAQREFALRALGTLTLGNGAALVQPAFTSFLQDYLHPLAVVRSMGITTLPLNQGTLEMPYFQNAINVQYVGEQTGPNENSPQDARMKWVRKTMASIFAMSKELAREASYNVDAFIRTHIGAAAAAYEDLQFIRGTGSAETPRGMKYWAGLSTGGGQSHTFTRNLTGGNVDVASITADAMQALMIVEKSKVPRINTGWISGVRDFYGLMKRRNATTEMMIWPELLAGQFYGEPIKRTPQIPENITGAGGNGTNNKSEFYFAAFKHLAVAEAETIEFQAFDGGTYKGADGNLRSGITNREVVLAMHADHDFGAMYRGDEVVCITGVDYGA